MKRLFAGAITGQVAAGLIILIVSNLASYTLGSFSFGFRKSLGIVAWERDMVDNGAFFDLRCEYRWITTQNFGGLGTEWAFREKGKYIFYPIFIHEEVIATSYDSHNGKPNAYWVDYDHRDKMRNRNNSTEFSVTVEKKCQI